MKIFKIDPEGSKDRANKTDIKLIIFILIFAESLILYDAKHNFSLWLRTDSNPPDINLFQSDTGKL